METSLDLQNGPGHWDVFILGGQSNMAGRGGVCRLESGQKTWDSLGPYYGDLVVYFNGTHQWVVAREPMHAGIDKTKVCGVGPGLVFASQLLEMNAAERVALVPCAVGGTCLDEWQPGSDLYQQMIDRTHTAMRTLPNCKLRGLLWYQGESDTDTKMNAQSFGLKLRRLITSFRQHVGMPNLPILQVAITCRMMASTGFVNAVRRTQLDFSMHNVWTVDAMGLELQEDGLHLTTAAQKWLGRELARQYKAVGLQQQT